jgi:hypothetical protein
MNERFHAWLVTILLMALGSLWGCSRSGENRVGAELNPGNAAGSNASASAPQSPAESGIDRDFLDRVKQAVVRHKLTKLAVERLSFELAEEALPGTLMVNVREKHDAKSGGDPATAPRLFSVRLDRATGVLWTDALSTTGEFEPLPKDRQ